ncbi:hypothetical protein BRAO285_2940049 [Bradyrhizobium sp. ORS 285]|nr:hypothetical protein BRAO285_2940049 [Bradyrhizobium sp. ORS 285]
MKCSKPKPGPPVVSISTVRPTPSASGFMQGARGGWAWGAAAWAATGTGAAAGVGAAAVRCACDQAAPDANSEAAREPANTNPAAIRIVFPRGLLQRERRGSRVAPPSGLEYYPSGRIGAKRKRGKNTGKLPAPAAFLPSVA